MIQYKVISKNANAGAEDIEALLNFWVDEGWMLDTLEAIHVVLVRDNEAE